MKLLNNYYVSQFDYIMITFITNYLLTNSNNILNTKQFILIWIYASMK